MKIITRAGHIGDDDNRFLGRSVYGELAHEITSASDLLALTLGARIGDDADRDALRFVALAATSPDARVWPVKLCRVLSSYGDPVAGCFGAQLVSAGTVMGPGTAAGCAAGLVFLAERAGPAEGDAGLDAALSAWLAQNDGRFLGFGVPFRPEDERLLALRLLMADHPLAERPFWRLHQRVVAAMARRSNVQPNVVIGIVALLLDLGVAPERCGVALSALMSHVFLAHALEAATTDGATLYALPAAVVDYQGVGARKTMVASPATGGPRPGIPREPPLRPTG